MGEHNVPNDVTMVCAPNEGHLLFAHPKYSSTRHICHRARVVGPRRCNDRAARLPRQFWFRPSVWNLGPQANRPRFRRSRSSRDTRLRPSAHSARRSSDSQKRGNNTVTITICVRAYIMSTATMSDWFSPGYISQHDNCCRSCACDAIIQLQYCRAAALCFAISFYHYYYYVCVYSRTGLF